MPKCGEFIPGGLGNPRLDVHVAPGKSLFRKPRSVQRALHVHTVIDDVRDKLRVRLRLIPAAHNTERDAHIALFHESRDDRMDRPLAACESVGVCLIEREKAAAVLQRETRSTNREARSKADRRK